MAQIPFILTPGTVEGYVVEAKYIKDALIVVKNKTEALQLDKEILTKNNNLVYLMDEQGIFSYDSESGDFVPSNSNALTDAPKDGKIYARQNGQWVEISTDIDLSNYYTKQQVDSQFISSKITAIIGGNASTIFI